MLFHFFGNKQFSCSLIRLSTGLPHPGKVLEFDLAVSVATLYLDLDKITIVLPTNNLHWLFSLQSLLLLSSRK